MALPDPSFFDNWQAYAQALNTELGKVYGVSGEDTVNQSEYEDPQLGSNILSEDGTYIINDNYVNNSLVPVGGNILPDWNFELTAAAGFGTSFSGDFWEESTSGVTVDTSGENSSRALSFDVAGGVARSTLNFPVTAGEVMYFSWKHFRPTSYTGNLTLQVRRLDSSGTLIGTTTISQNAGSENTWTTTSVEYTVPTGTFSLTVEVTASSISPSAPSVNWIWVSRTEYQATVGATSGTNIFDENGALLSDIDIANDSLIEEWTGGSVIPNGSLRAGTNRAGYGVPTNWYRRINGSNYGSTHYWTNNDRDVFVLDTSGGGHTVILCSEAFRINPDVTYEIVVRHRRTSGTGGLDVYMVSAAADLNAGKRTFYSATPSGTYDTQFDSGFTVDNDLLGTLTDTSWTVTTLEWDPSTGIASGKWAVLRLNPDVSGDVVEVDYVFIREKATRNTGTLADQDTVGTGEIDDSAVTVTSVTEVAGPVNVPSTASNIITASIDVGTDIDDVEILAFFYCDYDTVDSTPSSAALETQTDDWTFSLYDNGNSLRRSYIHKVREYWGNDVREGFFRGVSDVTLSTSGYTVYTGLTTEQYGSLDYSSSSGTITVANAGTYVVTCSVSLGKENGSSDSGAYINCDWRESGGSWAALSPGPFKGQMVESSVSTAHGNTVTFSVLVTFTGANGQLRISGQSDSGTSNQAIIQNATMHIRGIEISGTGHGDYRASGNISTVMRLDNAYVVSGSNSIEIRASGGTGTSDQQLNDLRLILLARKK